jgi:photosystem II stability/assembly factor-like uncharacterized protein
MSEDVQISQFNPVDLSQVEQVVDNDPAFDELRQAIIGNPRASGDASEDPIIWHPSPGRSRRRGPIAVIVAAAVAALVVGLVVFGGGNAKGPISVPSQAGRPTPIHGKAGIQKGTWRLMDDVLTGNWQQNTSGPPGGQLTCPNASTCYEMSGHYASAMAGAPLLSESLYASTDVGATWSEFTMPQGFSPTSPLSCGGPTNCAAGGTYGGRSVLISTEDGGHSFTVSPLPSDVGNLYTLDCTSADECSGLAANSIYVAGHSDATFLSTSNGGTSFTDSVIIPGDSMESLSCSSSLDCTAVGTSDALGINDWAAGVAATTTDGGRTWTQGNLPAGFGISQNSELSCADNLHCSVIGNIAINVTNPPQCASMQQPTNGATTTTTPPNAAVQAIARAESTIASAASQKSAASGGGFSCSSNGTTLIGDIASTIDGGHSWSPDPLPASTPQPMFTDISCPTVSECWATGSDAVPQQVGNAQNGGSSMLLGTTDGGSSWSTVSFSVPNGAPNYDGQSFLSLGFITCPTASVCIANGATAQGSPTAPIYSLTQRDSGY